MSFSALRIGRCTFLSPRAQLAVLVGGFIGIAALDGLMAFLPHGVMELLSATYAMAVAVLVCQID